MENERLLTAYERFSRLMTDERLYLNPNINYESVCRLLGVEPTALDRILEREIGYSGSAVIRHFREQAQARLRDGYGIDVCFGNG